MTYGDLPIICANRGDDTLTFTDRNFSHKLTRFRPDRSGEGNNIVVTGFLHEMIGDGMESKRFLSSETRR